MTTEISALRASHDALLGALNNLIGLVEVVIPTLDESPRLYVETNPRLEAARAAVAKAERV